LLLSFLNCSVGSYQRAAFQSGELERAFQAWELVLLQVEALVPVLEPVHVSVQPSSLVSLSS